MCAYVHYNTLHPHPPAIALPNEFEPTSGASSLNGHCGFLISRRLLHTKTTCGNNLGKGPSPDLKRSSLVYGILTCIGSLGLLNSSQNRPNSSEMASAEKDMYQDHCQWMALRLRYIEEMECIGLLSREYAPLHACHTFI